MRTVVEIYEEYRIAPWLQLHQLRVTAIARFLAERIPGTHIDTVVQAALFHDMGNVLKFDFTSDLLLSYVQEKGVEYWKEIQDDFRARYGDDEHSATNSICKEIGLSAAVIDLIDHMGFSKAGETLRSESWELKCVEYGDMRVSPAGIVSIEDRLAEGRTRYLKRTDGVTYGSSHDEEEFEKNKKLFLEVEKQLATRGNFDPKEVTNERLAASIEELKKYALS